jgi:hypothetical protein
MPCDPFDMALVHRAFRAEFAAFPGLIRAVSSGDTTRSRLVSRHLDNMIAVLHHHHAAEDELLWPKLVVRVPECESDIRHVEHQHAGINASIDKVNPVRLAWVDTADPKTGEQLAAVAGELSACVNEHLEDEESQVVPLIAEYITPDEWQEATDRGAAFLTPKNVGFALAFAGFINEHATAQEWRRFLSALPLTPRLLWHALGRRLYGSYRRRLYGAQTRSNL